MISSPKRSQRVVKRVATACGILLAASLPAFAQNYEGPQQVRVGAFLQAGSTTLDGTLNGISERGHFGNSGAGITAGYEFLRAGGWTYGAEADFGVTNGSHPIVGARYATDYFGSLRGRLGFYARPDWVLYGTAGIGFRGVRITDPVTPNAAADRTLTGGVFGAGSEWHRGNTIFFAEYLHSHFGNETITTNSTNIFGVATSNLYGVKGDSDSFRLGVKFKVGFDGYYDEVRDGLRK